MKLFCEAQCNISGIVSTAAKVHPVRLAFIYRLRVIQHTDRPNSGTVQRLSTEMKAHGSYQTSLYNGEQPLGLFSFKSIATFALNLRLATGRETHNCNRLSRIAHQNGLLQHLSTSNLHYGGERTNRDTIMPYFIHYYDARPECSCESESETPTSSTVSEQNSPFHGALNGLAAVIPILARLRQTSLS
jgi:hypothetical protein